MNRFHRLPYLLGAVLALGGCKSRTSEPEPAPAPSVAAQAPATAPTPAVAKAAAEPSPPPAAANPKAPSDFTLSYFQDVAPERCKWVRLEGSGTPRDVFTFDGPCSSTHAAWSPDGRMGALLQYGDGDRVPTRAWTVDLTTGQGDSLPLPETPATTELGFDKEGRLLALVSHNEMWGQAPKQVKEKGKPVFVFEGQKFPLSPGEGVPGLAHTYRREGDTWKRVQTVSTTFGTEVSAATHDLDAFASLGAITNGLATWMPEPLPDQEVEDLNIDKAFPDKVQGEGGHWVRVRTPGGDVLFWEIEGDILVHTPPVRFLEDVKLVELEKLELQDDVALEVSVRGNALLITSEKSARLYDAKQHKLLAALEDVERAFFWPAPGKASGAPQAADAP